MKADMLVLAAAGNCVRKVVTRRLRSLHRGRRDQPATPLDGGLPRSRGDVSAPAEGIWRAQRQKPSDPPDKASGDGEGTSYAVAITAGVAALWLSHHGRDRLVSLARSKGRDCRRCSCSLKASARRPSGWDGADFGAGIVDAEGLLRADPTQLEAVLEAVALSAHEPTGEELVAKALMPQSDEMVVAEETPADFHCASRRTRSRSPGLPSRSEAACRGSDAGNRRSRKAWPLH